MSATRLIWQAEWLRLRRQPLAWIALGALLLVLLPIAVSAGLEARDWRASEADAAHRHELRLEEAWTRMADTPPEGQAAAVAVYQLGRGDLGATRMPLGDGLALGVQRLRVLPTHLRATLDSRHVEARDLGPMRNPLLSDGGLPGVPAMVALLLPLAVLVLSTGLLQDEREHGRLGLLRVQSRRGMAPVIVAALVWRWLLAWGIAAIATLPALWLDPGSGVETAIVWVAAVGAFSTFWAVLGGLLSCVPITAATAMLSALGIWLMLTFAVPAGLVAWARREAPMPSRLAAIVQIREAQQQGEAREEALARDWYARHPEVAAQLPAVRPASFVPRVLEQDRLLAPTMRRFDERRLRQGELVERWAWLSPGLALALMGERRAGTDVESHVRYVREVDAFEQAWRAAIVPSVMGRVRIEPEMVRELPAFDRAEGGGVR